ncbi:cutC copper transporter [Obelidium mucronatum]|nr:cutC copper transporter [Obelidium mucronatum]
MTNIRLEVCVESVEAALIAQNNGASRIELCASLAVEGGITPSHGLIALTLERVVSIPVMVMIRPRSGDFCYSEEEFEIMKRDVIVCKQLKAAGVVFGILTIDGRVDMERMRILLDLSKGMLVTFHRAFDVTSDPFASLEDIISLGGIQRILTSGQDKGVLDGLENLELLVERAGNRISIMPGGGVAIRNLERILRVLRVKDIHMSLMKTIESPMIYRNPYVNMGSYGRSEYSRVTVDAAGVKKVVEMLRNSKKVE